MYLNTFTGMYLYIYITYVCMYKSKDITYARIYMCYACIYMWFLCKHMQILYYVTPSTSTIYQPTSM